MIPESCLYEQGDAPLRGTYGISARDESLEFVIDWLDGKGEHQQRYAIIPDGVARPFAGGDLIDEMKLAVVSDRELLLSGIWRGKERMIVQKQLDESLQAMRVTQLIRLPMGDSPANVSVYRRNARA